MKTYKYTSTSTKYIQCYTWVVVWQILICFNHKVAISFFVLIFAASGLRNWIWDTYYIWTLFWEFFFLNFEIFFLYYVLYYGFIQKHFCLRLIWVEKIGFGTCYLYVPDLYVGRTRLIFFFLQKKRIFSGKKLENNM